MFIDASALVAILKREPGTDGLLTRLAASPSKLLYSPLSRFEAIVSLARSDSGTHRAATASRVEDATAAVDRFLKDIGAENLDLTESIGTGALAAAQDYGRVVGHPAGLNLGDCFAYACAKDAKVAIIYKGNDFSKTDLA